MTGPAGDELAAEQRRLVGASSVINAVAGYVDDLVQLSPEQLPDWLTALGVPAGWRIARLEGTAVAQAAWRCAANNPMAAGMAVKRSACSDSPASLRSMSCGTTLTALCVTFMPSASPIEFWRHR
jgi:hypothetical protein